MTGVTPLVRKTKQVYRIAFSYKGVQCREILPGPHDKAHQLAAERQRAAVLHAIAHQVFRYTDFFPDSQRASVFGHAPQRGQTLKIALEAYRDRTEHTLERSTWNCYRRDIDNILVPKFGHMRIGAFKPSDARTWVSEQKLSLKRIRNILLPLRAVFDEAVEDEHIKANPLSVLKVSKLVPMDKRTSDFEPEPYTQAELKVLLANVPEPVRWAFQLWAYTGVRTGELIGLRWPRIDLEGKTIRIVETTTERVDKPRPKTPAGVRTIPLLPAALEAVLAMRKYTQAGGDRFTINPNGRREDKAWDTNKLADVWARAHKGTGITPRNPYQLRHSFASQLLSQGENPALIAKLLGHRTIDMVTRSYGRWISEGEQLGFDRPPRRFGMEPLWAQPLAANG